MATVALCLMGTQATLHAQSYDDLVFYSQGQASGTARNVATGGALNSMGGDLSTMATNPAGLGVVRKHTAYISGGLGLFIGKEDFRGLTTTETTPLGSFDGAGTCFHFGGSAERTSGLVGFNLGIAYNKLADYSYNYTAEGTTDGATYLDALSLEAKDTYFPGRISEAAAFDGYDWYLALARLTCVVEPKRADGHYLADEDDINAFSHYAGLWQPGELVGQLNEISSNGSSSEIELAIGFNISNQIFAGISLGVPLISHKWTHTYTERAAGEPIDLESYEFVQEASTEAIGINLKLGILGRPIDELQLGLSLETPSFMQATSKSELYAKSYFLEGEPSFFSNQSPQSKFEYSFVSPLKIGASAAFIIPDGGFIGLDYRLTATPLAQFTSARFTQDNRDIKKATRYTHALNLGGEYLIDIFAIRLGLGYQMNPYKKGYDSPTGQSYHAAAGFGIAFTHFWLDIAYRHQFKEGDSPIYSYGDIAAQSKHRGQQALLMATIGFSL
ncbi:MAG: hypothetical protein CSA97_02665 [Bacteroidetes bacterium]|nr:MAG: hypothetical protein CSA97_02665 [Bacteroidota bacterium]